jgi:Cu(I)/Ag(I) efflux system membrane fusion protein
MSRCSGFRGAAAGAGVCCLLAATLFAAGCGGGERPAAAAGMKAEQAAASKFHCPMHPTYIVDRMGSCPICGMDLVPVDDGTVAAAGMSVPAEGRTAIMIAPERRQLIGLTTVVVETQELARTIRAPATVAVDETRLSAVSLRVGGRIEELYADFTGRQVALGEPLFRLYSPDLLASQADYLIARKNGDPAVMAAARRRLELWDISPGQVADLERSGAPSDTLTLPSPAAGFVLRKHVTRGMAVEAGQTLYEIADLSRVWVNAFVYEQEIRRVATGQVAVVELSYENRSYAARVAYIQPEVDPATRSVVVRLEVDNPDLRLRPGMWATAEIEAALGPSLAVPAAAVIDTGRRQIAFVDRDDGHLEPRVVEIGERLEEVWEVRSGLAAGERVVARALFLVDAESQLRAAILGMSGGGSGNEGIGE